MSFRVRPANGEDFRAIYQMAKLTGGGFTNLNGAQTGGTMTINIELKDLSLNTITQSVSCGPISSSHFLNSPIPRV